MACRDCQLKCGNRGISENEAYKVEVPDWCPCPEVRYPETRFGTGGGGIRDYDNMGNLQ